MDQSLSEASNRFLNLIFDQINQDIENDKQNLLFFFEFFLAHIHVNQSANDFINQTLEEGKIHVQRVLDTDSTKDWFLAMNDNQRRNHKKNIRKPYFINLSKSFQQFYYFLRDSLTMDSKLFLRKYYYLEELLESNMGLVTATAHSFRREDYFWIEYTRFGYLRSEITFTPKQLIETSSHCVNNSQIPSVSHEMVQYIQKQLNLNNLSKEMGAMILKVVKEYFNPKNPFHPVPDLPVLPVKQSAPNNSSVKHSVTNISSNTGNKDSPSERRAECLSAIKNILNTVQPIHPKAKVSSSKASSSSSRHISRPFKTISDILKEHKISKQQTIDFFVKKRIGDGVQFNLTEDNIVNKSGLLTYRVDQHSATANQSLAAGILTCVLHSIRLLFVDKTVSPSSAEYIPLQRLLLNMVTTIQSWKIDDVITRLNLEDTVRSKSLSFESFIEEFVRRMPGGKFTGVGTTTWSSKFSLQRSVQEMYRSGSNSTCNLFFLSFSGMPAPDTIVPYVYKVETNSSHCDATDSQGKIDVNIDQDHKSALHITGMVFLKPNQPMQYSFQFITYSRWSDGQHQVYDLDEYGRINPIAHAVPYGVYNKSEERIIYYPNPKPLVAKYSDGRVLVGLILVRSDHQRSQQEPLYMNPPVLRRIDAMAIYCTHLKTLQDSNGWLHDEVVNGLIYLVHNYLQNSSNKSSQSKILLNCSIHYNTIIAADRFCANYVESFFEYSFFISSVNIADSHWICYCVSTSWQRIFIFDSYNNKRTASEVGEALCKYYKKYVRLDFEWILLPSRKQGADCVSCGLFTILNATIFLKSITEGSMSPEGPDPSFLKWWSSRLFAEKEKMEMRTNFVNILYEKEGMTSLLKWLDTVNK